MTRFRWDLIGLALFCASACSGHHYRDGIVKKGDLEYRFAPLGPGWKYLSLSENDAAFYSPGTGHSIAVNATCRGHEDAPLEVLTQHLLMGFTDRVKVEQDKEPMAQREALRSHYMAKLDGVPVELLLVVLKKDNCVYDFTYVSPPGRLAEKEPDFERVVQSFREDKAL
jgi:hypothetical protein